MRRKTFYSTVFLSCAAMTRNFLDWQRIAQYTIGMIEGEQAPSSELGETHEKYA